MRKKNTVRGCLSLGFLIHRHVCIEPMFFARSKNLAGTLPQGFYQSLFFSGSGFRLSAF